MQQKLAPLLFKDDQSETSKELRESVVQPAQVSVSAQKKASRKKNGGSTLCTKLTRFFGCSRLFE